MKSSERVKELEKHVEKYEYGFTVNESVRFLLSEIKTLRTALEFWRDYEGDNLDGEFEAICEKALEDVEA